MKRIRNIFAAVKVKMGKGEDRNEVKRILRTFFDPNHSTNINLDRLQGALGGDKEKYRLVVSRIRKRVDKEVKQRKAIETYGSIGDDGAGGPFDPESGYVRASREAKERGIIWYHFGYYAAFFLFGISKCIPEPGEMVEVV